MKQKLNILILMLFIGLLNIQAQNLTIYLVDGGINEYPISEIRSIKYSGSEMLLNKTDNTVLSWNLSNIRKYIFNDTSTEIVNNKTDNNDVLVYPNPSNGVINVSYYTEEASKVNIQILTSNGKVMKEVLSEDKAKGNHVFKWQDSNLDKGIYFIKILNNNKLITKKIIIL